MCRMCAPHRRAKHSKTRSRDFLKIATIECDHNTHLLGPKVRTSLDSSLLHMEPTQCHRDRIRHQAMRDLRRALLRMTKLRWFVTRAHQKSGASCSKTHSAYRLVGPGKLDPYIVIVAQGLAENCAQPLDKKQRYMCSKHFARTLRKILSTLHHG